MISLNKFETKVISLSAINEVLFCIPTYQRPYVWGEEQISKLLSDCINSFQQNPEKPYYLGAILTARNSGKSELIDGQQRFTTLWLIACSLNYLGIDTSLRQFLNFEGELRIDFEIREEIKEYFELLLKHPEEGLSKYSEKEIREKPYLKNIIEAVTTIIGIIQQNKTDIDLEKFGNFLYEKVLLVNNITPVNIDLNKLFATINNSGVQLEQTDIVKANLLKKVTSDKIKYSKIWECCENMNDYFERNIRNIFTISNWRNLQKEDFFKFDESKFSYKQNDISLDSNKGFTISEIVKSTEEVILDVVHSEEKKSAEINCRSIINFGQLLLHTFRIYLFKNNKNDFQGTFHVNRLIEIFKYFDKEPENEVKEFIKLLWNVRAVFDFYLIKWITDLDSKEEHLELTVLQKQDQRKDYSYFGRNVIEKSNDLMLQSVLYFTGDYLRQFWLTPYLYYLVENEKPNIEYLEKLDNHFSLSKKTDKETSFLMLSKNYTVENPFDFQYYLKEPKGTSFKHYWFQKVEYILWKKLNNSSISDEYKSTMFKKFRIASKNSVEHIYPQNPEYKDRLNAKNLDSFGNLVLLSVSQNSEYSRKSFEEKKGAFFNKPTFDSLKSYFIFKSNSKDWNADSIEEHREEILNLIQDHYTLKKDEKSN